MNRSRQFRLFTAALLSCALVDSASAALAAGDVAPDFSANASLDGKTLTYSLTNALKSGPVVVYFFPGAFTKGCNIQAHEFAVRKDIFATAGATVVGVSLDNIDTLNAFSGDPDYCGGKVPVASDVDGRIAKSYDLRIANPPRGAKDTRGRELEHGLIERTTFVVTPDGRIAATIGGLSPQDNVARALETVQGLKVEARR